MFLSKVFLTEILLSAVVMSGNCHQKQYPDMKIHVSLSPKRQDWNSVFHLTKLSTYLRLQKYPHCWGSIVCWDFGGLFGEIINSIPFLELSRETKLGWFKDMN